jgi:hypothetical protein
MALGKHIQGRAAHDVPGSQVSPDSVSDRMQIGSRRGLVRGKRMKSGAKQILGKTIRAIYIKRRTTSKSYAEAQLFLAFTDGSWYEFYTDYRGIIHNTSGATLPASIEPMEYMSDGYEVVWHAELEESEPGSASV